MYDFEVYTLLTRQRMDRALDEARRDWLAHEVAGRSPSGWATLARFLARVARTVLAVRARGTLVLGHAEEAPGRPRLTPEAPGPFSTD